MRIIGLALLIIGCQLNDDNSNVEFITYQHVSKNIETSHLITKVHRQSWNIGYSFGSAKSGQEDIECAKRLEPVEEIIRTEIETMLNIWLDALRESDKVTKPITSKFNFHRITKETDNIFDEIDLYISFYCSKGIAHAYMEEDNKQRIAMFLFEKIDDPTIYKGHLGASNYNYLVLLHEIGHSFGLWDVYMTQPRQYQDEVFPSTRGNNPPSIMSGATPNGKMMLVCSDDYSRPKDHPKRIVSSQFIESTTPGCLNKFAIEGVMPDDKLGLEWLYLQYHRPNKNPNNCYHPNYELEIYGKGNSRACVPKNPVMFTLKNGHGICPRNELADQCSHTIPQWYLEPEKTGYKRHPIHYAAMIYSSSRALSFIRLYPDAMNEKDTQGMTALHYAVRSGHSTVVEFLVDGVTKNFDVKANVNAVNNNSMTALHLAAQLGHTRHAEALLKDKEIDISIKDKWGLTALQRANYRKGYWERKVHLPEQELASIRDTHQTSEQRDRSTDNQNYAEQMVIYIQQVIDLINRKDELQDDWPCWGRQNCH